MRSLARVRPDVLSVKQERETLKRQKLTDEVVGQLQTRPAEAADQAYLVALLVNARRNADLADLAVGEVRTRLAAAMDPSAKAAVGSYDDDMQQLRLALLEAGCPQECCRVEAALATLSSKRRTLRTLESLRVDLSDEFAAQAAQGILKNIDPAVTDKLILESAQRYAASAIRHGACSVPDNGDLDLANLDLANLDLADIDLDNASGQLALLEAYLFYQVLYARAEVYLATGRLAIILVEAEIVRSTTRRLRELQDRK